MATAEALASFSNVRTSLTRLPYLGPNAGRFGRNRYAIRLSDSEVSRTSLTLSSSLSWLAIISSASRSVGELSSTISAFNGCRNFDACG